MFYIVDTRRCFDGVAVFWRANGAGYTTDLGDAGVYETLPGNLRPTDRPIPVDAVKRHAVTTVPLSALRHELILDRQREK